MSHYTLHAWMWGGLGFLGVHGKLGTIEVFLCQVVAPCDQVVVGPSATVKEPGNIPLQHRLSLKAFNVILYFYIIVRLRKRVIMVYPLRSFLQEEGPHQPLE